MRISLLQQREPFDKIFEKTLRSFLQNRFNQPYSIKWQQSVFSSNSNTQTWICNPYLNVIFVPGISKKALLPIIQEFSRSLKFWRRPFQQIYVNLALAKSTCKLFAQSALKISPPLINAENLVILGGNNHIRLLDYNEKKAFVIQKSGFDKELLINDIQVRKDNPYLPVPFITNIAENQGWYSEELILGKPINRLKDENQRQKAVEDVMQSLFQLYEKTAQYIKLSDYISEIIRRIELKITKISLFDSGLKKDLQNYINIIYEILKSSDENIVIAQTHGDFQPANILVGKKQAWLIDWEYTAKRHAAYDLLVFALKSRFSKKLSQRIQQAFEKSSDYEQMLINSPYIKWQTPYERRNTLAIFLLEELELRIKENSNPLFTNFDHGFKEFWTEAKQAINILKNK